MNNKKLVTADTKKQSKRNIIHSKSVKLSKKTTSFIRKLKLKSKSPSQYLETPHTSASSDVGRQNPEGGVGDFFTYQKSVSETNLLKSAETATDLESEHSACNQGTLEKTQSLEGIKTMPAYGDLMVDSQETSHPNKQERKDHLYKILVIGDLGAGKTSIIKRYVHRFFTQHYRATIGVDFALKVLNWDENTLIRLQLWDIAGQERYGNMTRVYYKEAVGAFIVFDVTRVSTFESVAKWKSDLDSKVQLSDGSPIPCVLLANKCDQQKEGIVNNPHKMEEYCKENNFTAWLETSAKENINIDEAAKMLVTKILENDTLLSVESLKDQEKIIVTKDNNGGAQNNGRNCSC